jgi:phosphoribosyl 1,2-cyclic phosphodiesterase
MDERVEDLAAVLLTHEHSDHSRGLAGLLAAHPELPVLATAGTLRALASAISEARGSAAASKGMDSSGIAALEAARRLRLGDLNILPIPVSHDAAEPVGFRIDAGSFALGLATDLGAVTPVLERSLAGCSLLVIESNHDLERLRLGPYPPFLKRRVASRNGHLSNRQASELIRSLAGPELRQVVLAHLSRTNNSTDLALRAVAPALAGRPAVQLGIASAGRPGAVLSFEASPEGGPAASLGTQGSPARQLELFDLGD